MVYEPTTRHPNGARLLALDGGGVRGVMALEILDEIMNRVKTRKGLSETCRPADYFELAAGTSTGGIIGIMLLGTGYTKPDSPSESWFQLVGVAAEVMEFSTNTNAKAKDFTRHMTTLNLRGEHKETKYVRLNPSLGKSQIGLADYDKMAELKKMARDYIKDERNQPWINKAVDA
ncbi:hypothetical protein FALBO_15716, partial [Fusarium albosuccineum]